MTFQEWVKAWFDHPEEAGNFWIDNGPEGVEGQKALDYGTLLFARAGKYLAPYSDTQIGNAIYGLIHEGDSSLCCLRDTNLSVQNRLHCIQAIEMVFRDVFAVRCTETLGHLSEPGGSLEGACYMWWDIFPVYTGCFEEQVLEEAVLDVQARILALPHAACQESALHGLGHWQRNNKKKVDAIIQAATESGTLRRPELVQYAQNARVGMVL